MLKCLNYKLEHSFSIMTDNQALSTALAHRNVKKKNAIIRITLATLFSEVFRDQHTISTQIIPNLEKSFESPSFD